MLLKCLLYFAKFRIVMNEIFNLVFPILFVRFLLEKFWPRNNNLFVLVQL
jgi:hypothetical protein